MKIFFDSTANSGRGGFLHEGIHNIPEELPSNIVEITKEEFDAAFAGQGKGKEIYPGPDGKPALKDVVISKEQAMASLRVTRNIKLAESDGLVARHRDQKDQGLKTTLSDDQYKSLMVERQRLRDLPQNTKDPQADHLILLGQK